MTESISIFSTGPGLLQECLGEEAQVLPTKKQKGLLQEIYLSPPAEGYLLWQASRWLVGRHRHELIKIAKLVIAQIEGLDEQEGRG